jgi:Tol biopolymer transport system component
MKNYALVVLILSIAALPAQGIRKDSGGANGDADYCIGTVVCNAGEGDCDNDAQCAAGLACGTDNGAGFSMPPEWDVCVPAHCTNDIADGDEELGRVDCGGSCGACVCGGVPGSATYCTSSCPCGQGQGDCDQDADCTPGLMCGANNGPAFGLPEGYDVCVTITYRQNPNVERVSVATNGVEANAESANISASTTGRWVVFQSEASTLVLGDTNNASDCFLRDRQTRTTRRISVASNGAEATSVSIFPAISGDARFAAFVSDAPNLIAGDNNGRADVFVHELASGTTTRISVSSAGVEANDHSHSPVFSEDGRFVAFASPATNLVTGDTTGTNSDVFVHDRLTGQTTRVSVSSAGVESNGDSSRPAISADGRFVSFTSNASNLVAGDTNNAHDVFVHDRQNASTTRVSVGAAGAQGNGGSYSSLGALSLDGRFVAFGSQATNLIAGDANGRLDTFVHDRTLGVTTRVSRSSAGTPANNDSDIAPSISRDGRYVAFTSFASNLVPDDTNNHLDAFVHDRNTSSTARVSVSSAGAQSSEWTAESFISGNGRSIIFSSGASTLIANDSGEHGDVFATPNPL